MSQKLHMQDQVVNKVDEIMSHYKTNQFIEMIGLIKRLLKKIASI